MGGVTVTIYLTIITTILVLTQVIRLIQNSLHLRHFRRIEDKNDYIVAVYRKLERALDTWEAEQAERAKAGTP